MKNSLRPRVQNRRRQVTQATKLCTVASNICWFVGSCHSSVAHNCKEAQRFSENLWTSVFKMHGAKVNTGLNKFTTAKNGANL